MTSAKQSTVQFLRKEWGIAVFTTGFTKLTDEACELMDAYENCEDILEATKIMNLAIRKITQAQLEAKAADPVRFEEMSK